MPNTNDLQRRAPRTVGALLTVTPCRKLYVAGWVRIHHGLVGAALVALGAALVWDDRHDWPFPIRDRVE
jgi:hypothetical protein